MYVVVCLALHSGPSHLFVHSLAWFREAAYIEEAWSHMHGYTEAPIGRAMPTLSARATSSAGSASVGMKIGRKEKKPSSDVRGTYSSRGRCEAMHEGICANDASSTTLVGGCQSYLREQCQTADRTAGGRAVGATRLGDVGRKDVV